jgi:2-polyprenyl-3-methyl-5-hydroxy-6-metoxy-1,4-benzoquinol methylase
MSDLPREILDHYGRFEESERLARGPGELERVRTQDILARHLPLAPATILDVGGAAGVHALPLARAGYAVHLIDPVARYVEQAREASRAQPDRPLASCTAGDARDLAFASASVDAVLCLGPLYHLVERSDRIAALREAHRVLRPDGTLFAATISRFGSLIDGLSRDLVADPAFVEIVRRDLYDGQHRNPTGNTSYFTTAFFHHPDELRAELIEAGFHVEKIIGVEGPVWFMERFALHWNAPEKRALLLELLQTIETDPSIIGASAHPLGIATKTAH